MPSGPFKRSDSHVPAGAARLGVSALLVQVIFWVSPVGFAYGVAKAFRALASIVYANATHASTALQERGQAYLSAARSVLLKAIFWASPLALPYVAWLAAAAAVKQARKLAARAHGRIKRSCEDETWQTICLAANFTCFAAPRVAAAVVVLPLMFVLACTVVICSIICGMMRKDVPPGPAVHDIFHAPDRRSVYTRLQHSMSKAAGLSGAWEHVVLEQCCKANEDTGWLAPNNTSGPSVKAPIRYKPKSGFLCFRIAAQKPAMACMPHQGSLSKRIPCADEMSGNVLSTFSA